MPLKQCSQMNSALFEFTPETLPFYNFKVNIGSQLKLTSICGDSHQHFYMANHLVSH